jgi:hypothetical protein
MSGKERPSIDMTVETAGPRTSVPDMTDLLERTNPTLPPREEPKLFEGRDFIPYAGAKRVFWDKMGHVQPSFKADCYAMLHIAYHVGVWVGAPAILLTKYFSGN